MTTNWKPSGEWSGQVVAVLGAGPLLTREMAALPAQCKTIAASRASDVYPAADMVVAIDGNGPPAGYAGMYVIGFPCDRDALYPGVRYERVTMADGRVLEYRNNGILAIRIAADMGAARIVLAGFDTPRYEKIYNFPGITEGLAAVIAEVRARGIPIDFVQLADIGAAPLAG